ncbi:hypothetical protein [Candidatus Mycobacterium methanotrophicum]|uniref:Uncharacterized protein n=1 Tax=Candidatus Mycobacterium methanotrophicum TaxID=2943498 RepID=A0ABY4QF49_9MYCO|nr:hypothetical protein [Candidatus Mycobacterium methanotrophicum]UQX09605.1 hypothetical protein M5I08_14690 [Candidatus Mycobacterium methanotrophicum]
MSVSYQSELKGTVRQSFSNPYDAMADLIGTEGEADVYVIVGGSRERLLHRDAEGIIR